MASAVSRPGGDEARLWALALGGSVLVNLALFTWISIAAIQSEIDRKNKIPISPPPPEQMVKIFPEMFIPEPQAPSAKAAMAAASETVRTSPDQESADSPASRRYTGERNTRATSDRAPTADDASMPSQAGREPTPDEVETTESDYQDGKLSSPDSPPALAENTPVPPSPTELTEPTPAEQVKGEQTPDPGEAEMAETSIREKLLDGPNPIDTLVPKAEVREDIKPREEKKDRDGALEGLAETKAEVQPKPTAKKAPIKDPAFRGNQAKTAIQGSISRTGRSALDVADTPMGRYQAQISRAVELEWQRNCVKHRDFITPGFLTVRFYIEANGKVKSVQFVGDIQTGEVQKGFTLNSIRNAGIPAMPPAVKKEMAGDALELIFNFYF